MNNTILSAAERKQYADRIRPIAADYDEYGVTSVRVQVRQLPDSTFVRSCVVAFPKAVSDGEELVLGGQPVEASSNEIILDETYPSLVALTEKQPDVAKDICDHFEGWWR